MLKIWGRTTSSNVQKVLWACAEMNIPFERIDAGLQFGRNRDPEYLALNPNGLVPTVEDGKTILCVSHSTSTLKDLCTRAIWLDHGRLMDDGPLGSVLDAYKNAMSPQAACTTG